MKVVTIPTGKDNFSYLLVCETSGQAAVIDPSEAQPVLRVVQQEKVNLEWILCTHHHADHIDGISAVQSTFPNIKIAGAAGDQTRIPGLNQPFQDGDTFHVGKVPGRTIATPGHTAGSVCYHFENVLFTGDTLFGGGCGRLFEGTAEEMFHSLNIKLLANVDVNTRLYFGHEYTLGNLKFALAVEPENKATQERLRAVSENLNTGISSTPSRWLDELNTNPFLRCTQPSVIDRTQKRISKDNVPPTEIFRILREWKNQY